MRIVWCTFSVVGFHKYPDAPTPVAYLSGSHRHEFKFKVSVEVETDNREIEFHSLKRDCLSIINSAFKNRMYHNRNEIDFDTRSCEMIAAEFINELSGFIPSKTQTGKCIQVIVDVSEDGECGGTVSRF